MLYNKTACSNDLFYTKIEQRSTSQRSNLQNQYDQFNKALKSLSKFYWWTI